MVGRPTSELALLFLREESVGQGTGIWDNHNFDGDLEEKIETREEEGKVEIQTHGRGLSGALTGDKHRRPPVSSMSGSRSFDLLRLKLWSENIWLMLLYSSVLGEKVRNETRAQGINSTSQAGASLTFEWG